MIIYTKQGKREVMPDLIAYQGGVYAFQFLGDETYTDPADGSIWIFDGVDNTIDEILGVTDNGINLLLVNGIVDCISTECSFFWDDPNGVLYVHWDFSVGDWSVYKQNTNYQNLVAGYANNYNKITKNVFDGLYYRGLITQLSGFAKKVDPTKLGLIFFDSSSYTLSDERNEFYTFPATEAVGVPLWAYYVDENETELKDEDRIFRAYLNGYNHKRDSVLFKLIESRFFENNPICKNTLTVSEYPNIGKNENKLKPVAFGDIRRGIMALTNEGELTTGSAGTAKFLLADPSIYPLTAITNVYDKEDNGVTITSSSLTNCTAEITKPAGVSVSDLNDYKWEGKGYAIAGTYNNGLDIIKAGYLKFANLPYLSSTFDTTIWTAETIKNDEAVGISVQSDKGFTEELIEPITTSLQGVVEILGDGRVSFASRDITASVALTVKQNDQLGEPSIDENTDDVVSELVVSYGRDFVDNDNDLSYIYSTDRIDTILDYSIDRRDPLSPVKTVLVNESDVIAIATEIMATSAAPERIISFSKNGITKDLRLFSIIKVDTGLYDEVNYEYGELLGIQPDYFNNTENITVRIIPDYVEA